MSSNSIISIGNIFGYWYHSVNGINYGLSQSDPIKRRPLYMGFLQSCFVSQDNTCIEIKVRESNIIKSKFIFFINKISNNPNKKGDSHNNLSSYH